MVSVRGQARCSAWARRRAGKENPFGAAAFLWPAQQSGYMRRGERLPGHSPKRCGHCGGTAGEDASAAVPVLLMTAATGFTFAVAASRASRRIIKTATRSSSVSWRALDLRRRFFRKAFRKSLAIRFFVRLKLRLFGLQVQDGLGQGFRLWAHHDAGKRLGTGYRRSACFCHKLWAWGFRMCRPSIVGAGCVHAAQQKSTPETAASEQHAQPHCYRHCERAADNKSHACATTGPPNVLILAPDVRLVDRECKKRLV